MLHVHNSIPAESIRLIAFDLDGTLIDSQKDLANSINEMLVQLHRQPLPDEIISAYIGDGAGMLVRRALGAPADEHLVERGLDLFLAYYREHKLDNTYVYHGVFDSLDVLRATANGRPRKMSGVYNK